LSGNKVIYNTTHISYFTRENILKILVKTLNRFVVKKKNREEEIGFYIVGKITWRELQILKT
jgi:polyhydroxyalkanoate synthesis regulator protein